MQELESWNDGPARRAIEDFVCRVTRPRSPHFVEPAARVAVFDNDGTLWCEKPVPVELDFVLQRLGAIAAANPALRAEQPWKAAWEKDYAWLEDTVVKHHHGDDAAERVLVAGMLKAFEGMPAEAYRMAASSFLGRARHPTLGRLLRDCAYLPMIELMRHLEARGFANYIACGGEREFMRVAAGEIFGVPDDRVLGDTTALRYAEDGDCGTVAYLAAPDVFDDGPAKPVRIWSRLACRPLVTAGNSNGDIPMLQFAGGPARPALRLLVLHDDDEREFAYVAGAERSIELARECGWTIVSMRRDWNTLFRPTAGSDPGGPAPAAESGPPPGAGGP
jgi:hypothetical protein